MKFPIYGVLVILIVAVVEDASASKENENKKEEIIPTLTIPSLKLDSIEILNSTTTASPPPEFSTATPKKEAYEEPKFKMGLGFESPTEKRKDRFHGEGIVPPCDILRQNPYHLTGHSPGNCADSYPGLSR